MTKIVRARQFSAFQTRELGYEKGLALSENSRPVEAIEELGRALKLDPGFASARAVLALYTPGEAGLQEIDRANQETRGLPEAERSFIQMLRAIRRSDTKEVVAEARKLVDLVPESPPGRSPSDRSTGRGSNRLLRLRRWQRTNQPMR